MVTIVTTKLNRPRHGKKMGKPKYVGSAGTCLSSAQPDWAEVWQAQVVPRSAKVQPMQNVDWACASHPA